MKKTSEKKICLIQVLREDNVKCYPIMLKEECKGCSDYKECWGNK